jgi:hypothetical protein
MYAALSRSVCALPLNLIWGFETTSKKLVSKQSSFGPELRYEPAENAHVLTCTLRFFTDSRLALNQNLRIMKPIS